MGTQSDIAAHIERLSFALRTSREKFEAAMNNGHEFHELKKILREIKLLEMELRQFEEQSNES
jgi:hypothetical protein